ncbi:hypothetical protein SNE40_004861 [Patella caerulea]|uniref:NADH dehydrogenase [ubiquinone] 1 alpha subcomplex assembly factor 2 n=1 Tax=Patella caerulea TaxID=87958 RepID=A0AAN8KCW4_PATCE
MSQGGGILKKLFMNYKAVLKGARTNGMLKGSDHFGNKYFEKVYNDEKRRPSRWIEAEDEDQSKVPDIPTEWDAWLRLKRQEPPTQQEVDRNYMLMLRTQKRAEDLKAKDLESRLPAADDGEQKHITTNVEPEQDRTQFPTYDDLEVRPGTFKDGEK